MVARCLLFLLLLAPDLSADSAPITRKGLNGLEAVRLESIRDSNVSALGIAALSIRPGDWQHAETANFVYHYFQSFIATPVSVEAEFYYRVIADELERDTKDWQRKCHIFIFEKPEDWKTFQNRAALDPWTGGIHANGELFIQRDPKKRYKGNTLGHEVAHLVLHRFFGPGIPLWLNEGYAEYAASKGYAAYHRARGFLAKPRSAPVPPAAFIPIAQLASATAYPRDVQAIKIFYIESEKLVRFLAGINSQSFRAFLECMARGNRFDTALQTGYGSRFTGMTALEQEFRTYASKDYKK
jgi:hypothetical protein